MMKNITLSSLVGASLTFTPHLYGFQPAEIAQPEYFSEQAHSSANTPIKSAINRVAQLNLPQTQIKPVTLPKRPKLIDNVKRVKQAPTTELATPPLQAINGITDNTLNSPQLHSLLNQTGDVLLIEKRLPDNSLAVAYEWAGVLNSQQIEQLKKSPISHLAQQNFAELELTLVSFRVAQEHDSREKLSDILPLDIIQQLDRNHIFSTQAKTTTQSTNQSKANINNQRQCDFPVTIGMVDTAIQNDHPFIPQNQLVQQSFLATDFIQPLNHGTAVAGRLIANHNKVKGAVPNAKLYAASVFYQRQDASQGATLLHLVNALNWLASKEVSVINLSLTGPENKILATVVAKLAEKDISIVAAVGNEGPAASPLFPAAYPRVIAVTAVDHNKNIYRWANQGKHVGFSAYGVNVLTTRTNDLLGEESGTSLATPTVSAAIACNKFNENLSTQLAVEQLIKQVEDLGEGGRDSIYGHGLVGSQRVD